MVFETARVKEVDHIIFLGDLFHDRNKIDVLTYQRTFEEISKTPVPLHLLLGNHDLWHKDKWSVSSCIPFSAIKDVYVIDYPSTQMIGDLQFDFLPYTEDSSKYLQTLVTSEARILCAHIAVNGAKLNSYHNIYSDIITEHDGDMEKIDGSSFSTWEHVFLGHYHAAQKISNNAEYIGSPLQLSFGEAFDDKHIIIFDGTNKEYIKNEFSPQHLILKPEEVKNHKLDNNFIRLIVEDISSTDIVDIRTEIETSKPASLEVTMQKADDGTKKTIEDSKAILYNQDEMLEKYIEEVGIGDLNKDLLLQIGKEICKSGESAE